MKKENIFPPQLTIPIVVGKTFRFQNQSGSDIQRSLSFIEILDLLCVGFPPASAYRIMTSVRLKSLEIWASQLTSGAPATVSFDPDGDTPGSYGPSSMKSDTAVGTARPAHIKVKFDERLQVGQWQGPNSSANVGFMTIPRDGIVDLTCTFVVQDSIGTHPVSGNISTPTLGQVYCLHLDSADPSPQLVPVSYVAL